MKNERMNTKPNNRLTKLIMQLMHWMSHLELSGGPVGEQDVGQPMLWPASISSFKGNEKINNQHKKQNKMKPNNRLTQLIIQLMHWMSHLELLGGSVGEQDVGQLMPLAASVSSFKGNERINNQHKKQNNMKSKNQFLKWLALLFVLVASTLGAMAQGPYPNQGAHTVCLNSTEPYGVILNPTSGYQWTIVAGTGGAGTITSGATPNLITVNWTSAGTCTLRVVEQTAAGCYGDPVEIPIIVNPLPIVSDVLATVCSDSPTGVTLVTTSTNGLTIDKWDITAVPAAGLTGTATTGAGLTSATAISADVFTNATGGPLTVVYTIVPYVGICSGASYTVTVTVDPEPVVANQTATICSDSPVVIALGTSTTAAAATYNITAIDMGSLTASAGSPAAGNGLAAGVISDDAFTNNTAASVNVVYTVVPVTAGGCLGDPFTVTVTVNPAPLPTISGDTPVCETTTDNTYTTETGMTNYVWAVVGGSITAGSGTNSITVTWNTVGTGTVSVNYNNANGCTAATPTVYNVVVNPLPATSPIYHN